MKKETQQLVLMLIIGILLGAVGTQIWSSRGNNTHKQPEKSTEVTNKDATSTLDQAIDGVKKSESLKANPLPSAAVIPANTRMGLTVADQSAGTEVSVSGFTLVEPRWFVVYDERGGSPSWILGAQRLLPGDTTGKIQLLRKTVAGQKYFVAIHNDDGNLEFNKMNDPAPKADELIIVSFTAK